MLLLLRVFASQSGIVSGVHHVTGKMNINTKLVNLKSQMKIEPEAVTLSLETFIREHMGKLELTLKGG